MTARLAERFSLVEAEIKRLLIEEGVTSVWRLAHIQEAVMPPTKHMEPLVKVLQEMLANLAPSTDFVIVDRYLFPNAADPSFFALLTSLLDPIARAVSQITFITGSGSNSTLFEHVRESLLAQSPTVGVVHRVSDDFHDRFWIADGSRGLFVGTSLNGLGKRYALVDYMAADDVDEIVGALKARGLIEQHSA